MLIPPPTAVLFDLDGTLLDTAPTLAFVTNQLLADAHKPPFALTKLRPLVSQGSAAILRAAFDDHTMSTQQINQLTDAFHSTYDTHISHLTCPFPGVVAFIAYLDVAQIPWGIVTNKFERHARPLVQSHDFLANCATLICGDTTPQAKPHPGPVIAALEALGAEADTTLFIGDARQDIIAGRTAGTLTAVARFGYLAECDKPDDWGADFQIHGMSSLQACFESNHLSSS